MKEARERAEMTQLDLARAAGVTVAAICRYEKGKRTPSVRIAKRISKVLGIPWPDVVDNKMGGQDNDSGFSTGEHRNTGNSAGVSAAGGADAAQPDHRIQQRCTYRY